MLKEVINVEIKNLTYHHVVENIETIKKFLVISYNDNFFISENLCNSTVENKILELCEYIKINKAILYGVFIDDSLVGIVWLYKHDYFDEPRLHVNHIIVDEDFRKQGIAKKLLAKAEEVAADLKISTIDLYVSENNFVATDMYKGLGYLTERRYLTKKLNGESKC